jgi:hypothetical protein
MIVTNLSSVFALDIRSANNTSPYVSVTLPNTTLLSPAQQLQVDARTQAEAGAAYGVLGDGAVSGYLSPGTMALLPVGGQLDATTSTPPIQLTVQPDWRASEATLNAGDMTTYTVDSFTNGVPDNVDSSYAASIAKCAIAALSLWNAVSQSAPSSPPSSVSAVDLIQKALHIADCQDLYKKLTEDANPPQDEGVQPDLATKAAQAEQDFEVKSAEAPREPVDIFPR